jgi:hypothetical protein
MTSTLCLRRAGAHPPGSIVVTRWRQGLDSRLGRGCRRGDCAVADSARDRAWAPGAQSVPQARTGAPTATRFSGRCGRHPHPFGSIKHQPERMRASPATATASPRERPHARGLSQRADPPHLDGSPARPAINQRVATINPDGRAPARSGHSVDVISQTSMCGRTGI